MEPSTILDIFIITYNRSAHLDDTLRQLVGCPFVKFPITILDNCSEDDTYGIFLKYKTQFPNLNYIKNKINVGADANVLRAAELSNGTYTWILCDDDYYDFTNCDDVFIELDKGEATAIMVGWAEGFVWPTGGMYDTPENLMKKNFPYFSVPTFVPGSIFKTDLFQAQIRESYKNIVNLLPVMTYYIHLFEKNNFVYVSKGKIVAAAGKAGYQYSYIQVMMASVKTFNLIKVSYLRRKAFYSIFLYRPFFLLIKHAMLWYESRKMFSFSDKWHYIKLLRFREKILFFCLYTIAPILTKIHISDATLAKIKARLT